MLSYEDEILIKTCGNLKYFLSEDSSGNTLTKTEKTNIELLSAKVARNQFDRTHCRLSRNADTINATEDKL